MQYVINLIQRWTKDFLTFCSFCFFTVSSLKYDINHTVSFSLRSAIKCARVRKHISDTLVFLEK